MRTASMIAGGLLLLANAATAASADYYLKIDAVGLDAGGPTYLKAHSSADLDGDGMADNVVVRLECAAGVMHTAAYRVISPRDLASGQASGKRTHSPVTFVKEWGPGTPQLMAMKPTYDVKKVEGTGAKTMSGDSWHQMRLSNSEELCAAAAAARLTKSRSNIQNN